MAAQASLGVYQEPMVVAPIHSLDMTNPPEFDRNLLQGAVTLGYTLYDGGGRGARIRRAESGEAVAEASGQSADMNVIVQVSGAYLEILSAEEILRAVEGQRAALDSEAERVRQFLEEGRAARVDLLRVEAGLSRVLASEISARSDLELARSRLARLTGLSLEAVEAAPLAGVGPREGVLPSRDEVLASAERSNPDLDQARQALAGASEGVREAKAGWFPKVEAGGRYNDFGTLSGGHVQEWQALVQVSYPLFSGGSRSGDQERAVAEERQAAESLRLARMMVEDEAESALASLLEARALREALEVAAAQSEEVARIEALALEAGAGVQTDFLEAQAELFQARAYLSRARHGEVLARIKLARVKGELTLGWIQENMEVVP
jgi:outer membrane protein TolC